MAVAVVCAHLLLGARGGLAAPQTLHVAIRLVEVNVVVHDKSGAPVSGLKRSDFTLLDGGKKQQISVFLVESGSTTQPRSNPLPPDVFSNLVLRSGGIPTSATVILLDGVNTRFGDLAYVRGKLIPFLQQLRPTDRVAIYTVASHFSVIQDFTSNPSLLIEALRHYSGQPAAAAGTRAQGQGPEASSPPLGEGAGAAAAQLEAGIFNLTRPLRAAPPWTYTLAELKDIQAIAHHLSGLPGRKSLIWVTGNVPLPGALPHWLAADSLSPGWGRNSRVATETLDTIRALNEADVALYPVDARGIFTNPIYSAPVRRAVNTHNVRQPAPYIAALLNASMPELAMNFWASETGGRAFYNTNDIHDALRDAMDDSELTYTLGYYPNDVRWKGEYRHLKVMVDRKGVLVRYRRGYYATPGEAPPAKEPTALLSAATDSPLDSTGIGLRVQVDPLGSSAARGFDVTVYMDPRGLTFHSERDRYDANFIIWAAQYSRRGDFLGATSKTVAATLDKAQYRNALAHWLPVSFQDTAKAGGWQLRVAVRDTPSGTIGSVRIPLHKIVRLSP